LEQNLCVLIDFENVAAGTEKEGLGRFDIRLVMRRLKDKGRILVARSYGDWGRFAKFKQSLLEQGITMVELTSYRGQDKNRADIAMVVDAMELAFTRDYLDTFVILSGDSDFTPLVTRLKELNKHVVGIGTRKSSSRLLVESCDEFMFYDVLRRGETFEAPKRVRDEDHEDDERETVVLTRAQAFQLLKETVEGLQRDQSEPVHSSVVKASMLRKEPAFDELEYGYKVFARFLEAAEKQGIVHLSRDSGRGGGYRVELVPGDGEEEKPARSSERASSDRSTDRERGSDRDRSDERSARGSTRDRSDRDRDRDRSDREPPAATSEAEDESAGTLELPTLSKAAEHYRQILVDGSTDPLTPAMRRAVVTALLEEVKDRSATNRRLNIQTAVGSVAKRTRGESPAVPPRGVRAVLQALLKAGELIHADGNPVRSPGASFGISKTAEALLLSLQGY
jgi:uncharacterized protein (TIGR00288 family)